MAIQMRRGAYGKFDPNRLLPGEWAVVQTDDPSAKNGQVVYMAFYAGVVKRMATYEDMDEFVRSINDELIAELTKSISELEATVTANEAARVENEDKREEQYALCVEATNRANEAAEWIEQAIQGDLGPLFDGYLSDLSLTPEEVGTIWSGSGTVDHGKLLETPGTEALVDLVQSMPDNKTIEYTSPDGLNKKLSVMDGAITKDKLAQELHDAILPPSGTDGDFLVVSSGAPSWAAPKITWRELWSGEWSIGEITIQDVADYDCLRVSSAPGMDGFEIIAFKTSYGFSGATCGYPSYAMNDNEVYMQYFVVAVSEDGTMTPKMRAGINNCPALSIIFSQNKVNVSTYYVTKIEGGRLA